MYWTRVQWRPVYKKQGCFEHDTQASVPMQVLIASNSLRLDMRMQSAAQSETFHVFQGALQSNPLSIIIFFVKFSILLSLPPASRSHLARFERHGGCQHIPLALPLQWSHAKPRYCHVPRSCIDICEATNTDHHCIFHDN
jgi:hypothetical protein